MAKLKFQEWRWIMKSYGAKVECSNSSSYAVAILNGDMISQFNYKPGSQLENNPECEQIEIWSRAELDYISIRKSNMIVARWSKMAYANTKQRLNRFMKEAIVDYNLKLKKYKKEKILSICKEKFTDD